MSRVEIFFVALGVLAAGIILGRYALRTPTPSPVEPVVVFPGEPSPHSRRAEFYDVPGDILASVIGNGLNVAFTAEGRRVTRMHRYHSSELATQRATVFNGGITSQWKVGSLLRWPSIDSGEDTAATVLVLN